MKKYRNIIASLTAVVAGLVLNFNACTSDSSMQSTSRVTEDPGTPFTMLKVLHPRLKVVKGKICHFARYAIGME